MFGQRRRPRPTPGGARAGTVDPGRVLRRRRGPLQLALGGVLVALILVVEILILQAYVNVNRSTAMFGQATFLTGNLVNVQREALLLNVEIEELAATHDLRGATLRRGLLGTQLLVMEGLGKDDPRVTATVWAIDPDLRLIDRALAMAKADPSEANLATQVKVMRPAIRRVIFKIKDLYDAEEQGFFGALSGTLEARSSSERLLVGLSGLDTALAHAIVKLSHTLQLHTVAEGIEHAEQAAHLATLGCQDGQGYHFARPLPAAAMTELLGKSLADGGFYLSTTAQPAGSLSEVG